MKNLRLALLGGSALLLAVSGLSVVACSDNTNSGFPTTKNDASAGGDDDDDDDDDASSPTDAGSKKDATTGSDAGTSTDSSTGSDATSAPGVKSADIYACGTPDDCPSGQNCYITAYSDWDGGNFYNTKCGLTGANGVSACKAASAALTSDTQVCAKNSDGTFTTCPAGTTCQTVGIYGKNFGACLEENGFDAGCSASKFISTQPVSNYCFTAPVGASADGGCAGATPVCCDQTLLDGSFANSCVATAADCAQ
jgi:hypothetical protein